jgi:hypothetical protein
VCQRRALCQRASYGFDRRTGSAQLAGLAELADEVVGFDAGVGQRGLAGGFRQRHDEGLAVTGRPKRAVACLYQEPQRRGVGRDEVAENGVADPVVMTGCVQAVAPGSG